MSSGLLLCNPLEMKRASPRRAIDTMPGAGRKRKFETAWIFLVFLYFLMFRAKCSLFCYPDLLPVGMPALSMKGVPLAEISGLLGDSLRMTEEHYAGDQPGKGNPLGVL